MGICDGRKTKTPRETPPAPRAPRTPRLTPKAVEMTFSMLFSKKKLPENRIHVVVISDTQSSRARVSPRAFGGHVARHVEPRGG